ncbi:hypothetical protein SAMN05444161_3138 [Rhizobiales bacterium GAS191]|nr:hypothetical protein SAMN05444161_3138 [Rhizobiales bacterium GAS191]
MKLFFGPGESKPISVATDLCKYLPEDRKYHYQDKFSMAEAAKSWVSANGYLPSTIAAVVGSKELNSAHFEYPTPVWGGGVAMTDVMAFLPNGIIAVEAKVNEPFDDLVSVWIEREAGKNKRSPPHRRKVINRYASEFGVEPEQLSEIRYQLLQRTLSAALTALAQGQSTSWMIVQSFAPANSEGHRRNRGDFDRFLALVGSAPTLEVYVFTLHGWIVRKHRKGRLSNKLQTAKALGSRRVHL